MVSPFPVAAISVRLGRRYLLHNVKEPVPAVTDPQTLPQRGPLVNRDRFPPCFGVDTIALSGHVYVTSPPRWDAW